MVRFDCFKSNHIIVPFAMIQCCRANFLYGVKEDVEIIFMPSVLKHGPKIAHQM
jgi:hypothetical protein